MGKGGCEVWNAVRERGGVAFKTHVSVTCNANPFSWEKLAVEWTFLAGGGDQRWALARGAVEPRTMSSGGSSTVLLRSAGVG